jgi:hypothetical protein
MPFTLAHPAAVLPLRRIRILHTAPLIIGALTPDLPYFVPGKIGRWFPDTHTFLGSFVMDVPLGFAVLLCAFLLRGPLTALMSARARTLCLGALERFRTRPLEWVLAPLSILIGVWTHLGWDSFTHTGGWMVGRVPALRAPVSLGFYTGEVCHVLQYVSSVIGLTVLAIWYTRLPTPSLDPSAERTTRLSSGVVLLLVAVAALTIGGLQASQGAHEQSVYRVIFLMLTRPIAWFTVLYLAAGTVVTLGRKTEPEFQS